ncbi:unnamed protein product [Pylaiella littoralis]
MFFTCCTLHNMLHAYDGLDELEPAVEWGGKEGLHNGWDRSPLLDESITGSTGSPIGDGNSTPRQKELHFALKNALVAHFEVQRQKNSIRWLKHKAPGRRFASSNVEITNVETA